MRSLLAFCLIPLLSLCVSPGARAAQDPAEIRQVVDEFLRVQIKGLPGTASYTIGAIQSSGLEPCASFDVASPPAARPYGRSHVQVRCVAGGSWSLFVPVHIKVAASYVISARPLNAGQVLTREDVALRQGDLAELPAGVLSAVDQAVGKTPAMSIPAARPLRADMLRQTFVLKQGQAVKLLSTGPGFEVSNEGKALANAAAGQVVQVRLATGQVVSGVARADGVVEVNY